MFSIVLASAAFIITLSLFIFINNLTPRNSVTIGDREITAISTGDTITGAKYYGKENDSLVEMTARVVIGGAPEIASLETTDTFIKITPIQGDVSIASAKHASLTPGNESLILSGDANIATVDVIGATAESFIINLKNENFSTIGPSLIEFPSGIVNAGKLQGEMTKVNNVSGEQGFIIELNNSATMFYDEQVNLKE